MNIILSVYVSTKALKKNRSIIGIFADQEEIKISQYADDIAFIASLSQLLSTHDKFGEVSGLKLNSKKLQGLRFAGSEQIVGKMKFVFQAEISDGKITK